MDIYFAFILGIMAGLIIARITRPPMFGTLRIDHSNPKKDVYQFVFDDFDDLSKYKKITLKVDHKADLSHD